MGAAAMVHNSLMSGRRSGNTDVAVHLADVLDALGAVIAVGLLTLTLTGHSGAPRVFLALAFASFVPGRAIVSNWPLFARWAEAGMSMVCSLAILGLLATTALWAHFWHPLALFQAEAVVSLAGLMLGTARRHTRLRQVTQRHGDTVLIRGHHRSALRRARIADVNYTTTPSSFKHGSVRGPHTPRKRPKER